MSDSNNKSDPADDSADPVLAAILRELEGIRFGQVTVTVQDGHIVQIERVERRRLSDAKDKPQ